MNTKEVNKILSNIKKGDYIAFEWKYGLFGSEIVVTNITEVYKNDVLVHFLYGYKSESEFVSKKDIIAIGDTKSDGKIKGWSGNFNIILKNHKLLK